MKKTKIYFFQWISELGGADTRLKELIQALSSFKDEFEIFSIPNDDFRLTETENVNFLKENNVTPISWSDLPKKTDGYAIAFCNFRLFSERWRIEKIKSLGLKFIWSNDMMWRSDPEISCLNDKLIDANIYTSIFNREILKNHNKSFVMPKSVREYIVPNYFHLPNYFKHPRKPHLKDHFVLGKLSRSDLQKYSENFPLFFEKMPLKNPLFRMMGWNENVSKHYSWHDFDKNKWELLPENAEDKLEFLSQLDVYVFNANHTYIENQTRSMIEAQLLGIPTIAPNYGNFPNMVWHTRNGFIYRSTEELFDMVKMLESQPLARQQMGNNAKNLAKQVWCDKDIQINLFKQIFKDLKS
jgi:glycosyltransferase involved in cell wall biosynthesis